MREILSLRFSFGEPGQEILAVAAFFRHD